MRLVETVRDAFAPGPRDEMPASQLPAQLTIEVTNVCNIHPPCVMCGKHFHPEQGWLKRDAAHFPARYLPKLENVLKQLRCISLYGIGEPLAHPRLFDFVRYVPASCHIQLTSNGWLLTPENRRLLLEHRVTQIDFSLDAASPERYVKIRHGDLAGTRAKISALVAERAAARAIYPNVILNMCLMRENLEELPDFVRLAKSIGADFCYAVHLNQGLSWQFDWFNYEEQHCALEPERHDRVVAEAFAVSRELQMPFAVKGRTYFTRSAPEPNVVPPNLPSPAGADHRYVPASVTCGLPWTSAIVHKDGHVTNCCWQQGSLGSLEDSTFEEIWAAGQQRAIRKKLLRGSYHDVCRGKTTCPPRGRP